MIITVPFDIVDEGRGCLRWTRGDSTRLGIYRHEGHRILICLGESDGMRPTSFRASRGQDILTLRRVRSGK